MQQEEPLIPGGYILLSRKIIDSEIWQKPPLYLKVWIYLLSAAQHRGYKQLKRGQVRTSIPELIEVCSWKVGFRTERPTKDQIYQILNWLREASDRAYEADTRATMITTTRATHGLLINVDNYSFYQDSKNYESNAESNNEAGTKPDNINKNDKNVKNVNKDPTSRNKKMPYSEDESCYKAAVYLKEKIRDGMREVGKEHLMNNINLQSWANDFRLMFEVDKVNKVELYKTIEWATADPFWRTNILSAGKLRKQYKSLVLKMSMDTTGNKTNKQSKGNKVNDNMEFFYQGLEGDRHDKGRVEVNPSESFPSLPKPST